MEGTKWYVLSIELVPVQVCNIRHNGLGASSEF